LKGRPRVVGEPRGLWAAFAAPGVLWLILLFVVPVYAILAVAMGTTDPIFFIAKPTWDPLRWDTSAFREVFHDILTGRLGVIGLRTIVYVAVASTLCILIGYPVAYYAARRAGHLKPLFIALLVAPFWINYIMRMLAWVNLLDTDGYVNRVLLALHILQEPRAWLVGRPETVILGMVYGYIPFFILPLFAVLDAIDQRVLEASRDLGASPARTFVRVTLPLSWQGILAGTALIMLPMFGDYYTPEILSGSPKTTLFGNQIAAFVSSGAGGTAGAALTVVLMAFVSVLMTYYLVAVARASREGGR